MKEKKGNKTIFLVLCPLSLLLPILIMRSKLERGKGIKMAVKEGAREQLGKVCEAAIV